MSTDFWTWLHVTGDSFDEPDLSLIAEARRLAAEAGGGKVTVAAIGENTEYGLEQLGRYGANQVIRVTSPYLAGYNGDLFAETLNSLLRQHAPTALLMVHNQTNADLAGRLSALTGSAVITRVVDVHAGDSGHLQAMRPIANGYLFETVEPACPGTTLLTFMPGVLADPIKISESPANVQIVAAELDPAGLRTRIVEIIDADPETLTIEEADIVVAGGRGAGIDDAFEIIHRLAQALGGSVAGTRPVIDWHTLPFERQIGQTGKTVSPRLIINCGISGANEYTAGIEKAQVNIAINNDPRARIFRFADLGIVGDLHQVLPLLIERLGKMVEQSES